MNLYTLRERVREAAGPDRELDVALASALVPDVLVLRQRDDDSGSDPYTHWQYTSIIDDALALVERRLPVAWVRLDRWTPPGPAATASLLPEPTPSKPVSARGATLPLAILDALLSALITQENEDG